MSRTRHLTRGQKPPHRQSSPARLTLDRNYFPTPYRPENKGSRAVPCGGYAAARREQARSKKRGKRIERRRRNREVSEE